MLCSRESGQGQSLSYPCEHLAIESPLSDVGIGDSFQFPYLHCSFPPIITVLEDVLFFITERRSGCPPLRRPVPERQVLCEGKWLIWVLPPGRWQTVVLEPVSTSQAPWLVCVGELWEAEFLGTCRFSALLSVVSMSSPACAIVQFHRSI